MEEKKNNRTSERLGIYVRLTEKEMNMLNKEERITGLSRPKILIKHFVETAITAPSFENSLAKELIRKLGQIGNNINQIARWVNSGSYYGDLSEISDVKKELITIRNSVAK